MVDFTCLHCNTHFSVADELGGRQGWCRSCKRMIIVPMPDGSGGVQHLSVEERCNRLDRLVQYAAAKADRYRLMLYQMQQENEKLSLRMGVAEEHVRRLHSAEERLAEAQGAMEGLVRELERGATAREQLYEQNEALHRENAHLLSELALAKEGHASADKRLSDTRRLRREDRRRAEDEMAALREQLTRVKTAASDHGDWEAVLRERDHLRGALDAAQVQRRDAEQRLAQVEADREAVAAQLADLHRQQQSADGGAEELRVRISAMEQQLSEAEAAWEASEAQRVRAEEAAGAREQELRVLRDAERRHKSLSRKFETLEHEHLQMQERLADAQQRVAEAAEGLATSEARAQVLREEAVSLKEALQAAEQSREAAVRAKEAAEQASVDRFADFDDGFGFVPGDAAIEEGVAGADEGADGKKAGWRLFGRTERVELVPLGDPVQNVGADIILTPELLGDDPLTDNLMSFLDPEGDESSDEMSQGD